MPKAINPHPDFRVDVGAALGLFWAIAVPTTAMVMPLIDRRCPTCGSADCIPEISSNPPGEGASWETLSESWRGFFKVKVFLTYARCTGCGLLFAPRYFSSEALGRLYGDMPDNSAGVDMALMERTQHGYYRFLREHCDLKGDYFELGPDIGLFTRYAARDKPAGFFWLFEPNARVHEELKKKCNGRDTRIRAEMFDFSEVPDGTLGACVLIHVMDHLLEPKATLEALSKKLVKGGCVLVVTHDERSALARLLKGRWPAFCLQHGQLYNRASTRMLMEECGLEIVETRGVTSYFPFTYLVKHFLFAVGFRRLASAIKGTSFSLPLKLGNIMTVARKT